VTRAVLAPDDSRACAPDEISDQKHRIWGYLQAVVGPAGSPGRPRTTLELGPNLF